MGVINIMTAETVKKLLPVIIAFANRQPVQTRSRSPRGLLPPGQWMTINPDTTEFRLNEYSLNESDWRVADTVISEDGENEDIKTP